MNKLILFFALSFLCLPARSEETLSKLDDLNIKLQDNDAEVTSLNEDIAELKKEIAKSKDGDGIYGIFNRGIRKIDEKAVARTKELLNQLDQLENDRDKFKKTAKLIKDDIGKEERSIKAEKNAQKKAERVEAQKLALRQREIKYLESKLRYLDVESDISKIDYKSLSAEIELNKLQSAYDKSLLGAYLQEKMALLLQSNVVCESISDCTNGARGDLKKSYRENLGKEVFPKKRSASGGSTDDGIH